MGMNEDLYSMGTYIEDQLLEYMDTDENDPDLFFKMALVYELHRIATNLDKLRVVGSVDTYEQNLY